MLLLAAGTATLATIVWAAYLFTTIWLRVRCARELAGRAESLPVMNLVLEPAAGDPPQDVEIAAGELLFSFLNPDPSEIDAILERLEALQHPGMRAVLKELFGRREASSAGSQSLVYHVGVSGRIHDTTVRLLHVSEDIVDVVTPEPQAELSVLRAPDSDMDSAPVAVTLTARHAFRLWDMAPQPQCFSATDSAGEKLWIITRSHSISPDDSSSELAATRPSQELVLVDSAGRIYPRLQSPDGVLLGRLPEPLGLADQLVFGSPGGVWQVSDGGWSRQLRLCTIGVIDRGRLRIIRNLQLASPRMILWDSAEPIEEQP